MYLEIWKKVISDNAKFAEESFLYKFYEEGTYNRDLYSGLHQAICGYKESNLQDPIIENYISYIFAKIHKKTDMHENRKDPFDIQNIPDNFREKQILPLMSLVSSK